MMRNSPLRRLPAYSLAGLGVLALAAALLWLTMSDFALAQDGHSVTTILSATLTVDKVTQHHHNRDDKHYYGCDNEDPAQENCSDSSVLSDDDFTYGGATYVVDWIYWESSDDLLSLAFVGPSGELSGNEIKAKFGSLALNFGSDTFSIADAVVPIGDAEVHWLDSDLDWTDGQVVSLRLTEDTTGPRISAVAVVSEPGSDQTYKTGDDIKVAFTFDEPIVVTGTPTLKVKVGSVEKTANCARKGSVSPDNAKLVCAYRAASGDNDADGIQVEAAKLALGSGVAIKDAAENNAAVTYTALSAQSGHKVDTTAPAIAFPPSGTPTAGSASTMTLSDANAKIKKYGAMVVADSATDASGCDTATKVGAANLHTETTPVATKAFSYTPPADSAGKKVCAYAEDAAGNSQSALWATAIVADGCKNSVATPDGSPEGLVSDCQILLDAKDTLAGSASLNWSRDTAIGSWDGATVRDERVTELDLPGKALNGTIPAALGDLSALEYLDLNDNSLTGGLPASLGNLTSLNYLYLNGNRLTGGIPEEYAKLDPAHLWDVDLTGNILTGTVGLTLTPDGGVSAGAITEHGGPQTVTVTVTATLDPGSAWANFYGHGLNDASRLTVTVAGSGSTDAVDFEPVADFALDIAPYISGEAGMATYQVGASADFDLAPVADSEAETDETVTVSATGIGARGSADLKLTSNSPTLTIIDGAPANSNPRFSDTATTRTVAENSASGSAVGAAVAAVDPNDDDTLTYTLLDNAPSIRQGNHAALFDIDAATGQIRVKAPLDYEAINFSLNNVHYSVIVTVSDGKDADGNTDTVVDDTIDATIIITDVDEPGLATITPAPATVGEKLWASVADPDFNVRNITVRWERLDAADATSGTPVGASPQYTPVAEDVGKWLRVTFTYDDAHGTGKTVSAVTASAVLTAPPHVVEGPAITTRPTDNIYGASEAILVTLTFSEPVTVTGSPRLRLIIGDRKRWAQLNRFPDDDGVTLFFAYIVKDSDADADGISVVKNSLRLNKGTIENGAGRAAKLKHPALPSQPGHKVDGSLAR